MSFHSFTRETFLFLPIIRNFFARHAEQLMNPVEPDVPLITQVTTLSGADLTLRPGLDLRWSSLGSCGRAAHRKVMLQPLKNAVALDAVLLHNGSFLGHHENCPHAYLAREEIRNLGFYLLETA